jgi:hypothetical protein
MMHILALFAVDPVLAVFGASSALRPPAPARAFAAGAGSVSVFDLVGDVGDRYGGSIQQRRLEPERAVIVEDERPPMVRHQLRQHNCERRAFPLRGFRVAV